jgi:hypothetical protein
MKLMTTDERVAGAALILGGLVALLLLPLWAPMAAVWLLATGRSLRSCGREANRMSGGEAGEA